MKLKRIRTRQSCEAQEGWAVVGDWGAIEFWIDSNNDYRTFGGVEIHQRIPFECSLNQVEPDYKHCEVLDGPCSHDGSSLWACEHWIPTYQKLGDDAEKWIWAELEREYEETWVNV